MIRPLVMVILIYKYELVIEYEKFINLGDNTMMTLEDIKNDIEIINDIDWDMTPEEAVTLYLEWGNNWSHGKMVRSKEDQSYYFVANTWENSLCVYLIKRNSEEAIELATIDIPKAMEKRFLKESSGHKGVYALNDEIKLWLRKKLNIDSHCRAGGTRCAHRRTRHGVMQGLRAQALMA